MSEKEKSIKIQVPDIQLLRSSPKAMYLSEITWSYKKPKKN